MNHVFFENPQKTRFFWLFWRVSNRRGVGRQEEQCWDRTSCGHGKVPLFTPSVGWLGKTVKRGWGWLKMPPCTKMR